MDSATQKFVDAALETYTQAVEKHQTQVAKMTKDYEDMVAAASEKLELLRHAADPKEDPEPEPEPPTVAKVTAESGEVFYAFNEAAYAQQQKIMDGMLDVIQSL